MKTKLYNQSSEVVGEVELPDRLFAQPMNRDLVHQVARVMRASQRQSVAHVKGRGEVRGGGRKPWPQKGTGRARHGSIRSPIWKGGGVTHGPTKEKVFRLKINQKMKQKAIAMVLSEKSRRGDVRVLDEFRMQEAKTKRAAELFDKFLRIDKKRVTATVLLPQKDEVAFRAIRNLSYVKTMPTSNVNVLDLLDRKMVIFPKASIEVFEKTFRSVKE
ncbi:MAG: 50S ribosomal protein L4 [Parcubacteria group bacterium]|nr:50S ribosomal protein L4 [Parcubacteria group bacterium]